MTELYSVAGPGASRRNRGQRAVGGTTEAAAGVSNEEWWFARSAMMEQVAPDFAKRFPMVICRE